MFNDREFILDPLKWPCWPLLPVKRRNNKLEDYNLGTMVADGSFTVYHEYLDNMKLNNYKNGTRSEYKTVDELLADGWRVD